MRFHLVTLGCDKNTVDSERYVAELAAHGPHVGRELKQRHRPFRTWRVICDCVF